MARRKVIGSPAPTRIEDQANARLPPDFAEDQLACDRRRRVHRSRAAVWYGN